MKLTHIWLLDTCLDLVDLDWTLTGLQTATRPSVAEMLIACGPGLDLDWFAKKLEALLYPVTLFLYPLLSMVFLIGASCLVNAYNRNLATLPNLAHFVSATS